MFDVSFSELLVILVLALLVYGPGKLPEAARTLGRLSAQLRRNTDQLRREFYNAVYAPLPEPTQRSETVRTLRPAEQEPAVGQSDLSTSKPESPHAEAPAGPLEPPAPERTDKEPQ